MATSGFQRTLSTLARTPNHSAAEVLAEGIEGPSQAVRRGAVAAFARRKGEVSQRKFLGVFQRFTAEETAALTDAPKNVRTTLRKMLAEHDGESSRAACYFITACRAFDEFPALVTAAIDPDHPGGEVMSSTALQLARELHQEILAYRRAPSGRDPSFARRWALTALAKAVDRFREHRRVELLEAFLLITTPGNHTLTQLLSDPTHPGHDPLLTLLRTSPSVGAIEVLARLYDDLQTPLPLLEIAAERTDDHFRSLFLQAIGNPPSARVLENVQRIKKFPLLDKPDEGWFRLPGDQQSTLIQMVMASRFSRRSKIGIADEFLKRGAPPARVSACGALGTVELPEATARLEALLDDSDPHVVAVAAKALRRQGYSGAVQRLAALLDHPDANARKIAQSGLRDFTFLRYVGEFDKLDAAERRELGRIVRATDADALDELCRELTAATLSRKMRGLQMVVAMDAVDKVLELVIQQASHQDAAVRAEAVIALGSANQKEARLAIETATRDTNTLVRKHATEILQTLSSKDSTAEAAK